jgi:hypothetical protein
VTRRTAITAVDPLIEPFLTVHLNYREAIGKTVAGLTDDELAQVADLFLFDNLRNLPNEFWPVAPRVRVFIAKEQASRAERQTNLKTLYGDKKA